MPLFDPTLPGIPTDGGDVSDHDGPPSPVPLHLRICTISGEHLPLLYCDRHTSVGAARVHASQHFRCASCLVKLVWKERVLQNDYTKVLDLLDGYDPGTEMMTAVRIAT